MKKMYRTAGILALCAALAVPSVDAQQRGRGNTGSSATHAPASTPGNHGNPGNSGRPTNNQRPGNQGHGPNQRPGNQRPSNPGYRPGGQTPPGNNAYRPGGQRPPQPPVYRPHGPVRPNMPPPRPFYRPAPPPPGWRPAGPWSPITSILGITLGTAMNLTINSLLNQGYVINSYSNNVVYLDNVQMLNMFWPDAALYFNSAGQLYASRFIYDTYGYDPSRYDMVYTALVRNYGAPISTTRNGNGVETTWWGPGNQFIHLSYASDYSSAGVLRYYTILSFGN